MRISRLVWLTTMVPAVLLSAAGCSDGRDSIEEALVGVWSLRFLSADGSPDERGERFRLAITRQGGWFDSGLTTDCGMDGPFGSWSGNWREVEVKAGRAPEGSASGSLVAKCILSAWPMSGHLIEALFDGDRMVGKVVHQTNRGNKVVGPVWVPTNLGLFVGHRERELQSQSRAVPLARDRQSSDSLTADKGEAT